MCLSNLLTRLPNAVRVPGMRVLSRVRVVSLFCRDLDSHLSVRLLSEALSVSNFPLQLLTFHLTHAWDRSDVAYPLGVKANGPVYPNTI